MPIPLYIQPTTPLPGPADFTTPIVQAFQARDRRQDRAQQGQLERERMAAQQQENRLNREQSREQHQATNKYNEGMLNLYKGDRERNEREGFLKAARAAQMEYLQALERQKEAPGALIRAEQKLRALGINPPAAEAQAQSQGSPPPSSFRGAPVDFGGPLPLRGLY